MIYSSHYRFGAEGEVWVHAIDMPSNSPAKDVSIALNYGYRTVGEREFLLPLHSVTVMTLSKERFHADTVFTDYKKFSADSAIDYADAVEKK